MDELSTIRQQGD
jgi:hypothetical protein